METVKFITKLNKRKNVCTICQIVKDGELIAAGEVVLYPKDTYDKVLGQKLSLTRALAMIKRSERKRFWDWFFNHSKQARKRYENVITHGNN
jgi:hypothetical protein